MAKCEDKDIVWQNHSRVRPTSFRSSTDVCYADHSVMSSVPGVIYIIENIKARN